MLTDEYFMQQALKEARAAFDKDEVPIGAVVVCKGNIIARGHNQVEMLNDNTAHAEILALTAAFGYMNSKVLDECTLYVTIEPCIMCAGALYWSRPQKIVYGASEPKHGFTRLDQNILHPGTQLVSGVLAEECAELMKSFFRSKRPSKT